MGQIDITAIEREIIKGLPNETARLDEAKLNIEVFNGTFVDPELPQNDPSRRDLRLMNKVIDALTSYAYQDPPERSFANQEDATRFLQGVYEQNQITTLLRASDKYRHAGDVFAFQVHATGQTERPIKIYSWTADSLVVWCDPEDQTRPVAVCTIDRFDQQTRYRLWTETECRTYVTRKWNGETSGARVPSLISADPNPYGILPFVFCHLLPPVTQFQEGGIGSTMRQMERHVNLRLQENADHLRYSKPRGFLLGVPAEKKLNRRHEAGVFERFPPIPPADSRDSGNSLPQAVWIGPPLDWVELEWTDLKFYWSWALESLGVPAASIPLEKAVIATVSGAALIAQNIPLFLYARKTQEQYRGYEQELAKTVLTVANRTYGGFGEAINTPLTINFGEVVPDLPPDSPDDYLDGLKAKGELSEIQVVQKRFGLTREQAVEHLRQVAKDARELAEIREELGQVERVAPEPIEADTNKDTENA